MNKHIALSPSSIDKLASGSIPDSDVPGLAIVVAGQGKKIWRFKRVIAGTGTVLELRLGRFPVYTIADARAWARPLANAAEMGIDPRVAVREAKVRVEMTVAKAHALYIAAMRRGDRKKLKPRTLADKDVMCTGDIEPRL